MKLLLLFNEFFLYLNAFHRNLNFLEQTCTFLHLLKQLSSLSYVCFIRHGIFILPWLFCFAATFFFSPWLYCFAVAFLFCRSNFCFAMTFLFCRGFFVSPQQILFCRGFFVSPQLFRFGVAFLFFLFIDIVLSRYSEKQLIKLDSLPPLHSFKSQI